MEKVELHFFHGFLGLPEDWDSVLENLSLDNKIEVHRHNLWSFLGELKEVNFESLQSLISQKINKTKNRKIGIGYSLGGRILMHSDPSQFSNYIFIASHPGLESSSDREGRLKNDAVWSQNFLSMEWDSLISLWNDQGVFSNDKSRPVRKEEFFNRELLSQALSAFSLGKQKLKNEFLTSVKDKALWVCGDKDDKFMLLRQRIEGLIGNQKIYIVKNSGHGCIFSHPQQLAEIIKGVLS